jgi:two-component system phosphate regulon response regulator PhoB
MVKLLKPSVLVVEDEESIATVIKYNLQKEGYQVHITDDGEEAIYLAKNTKPDTILLDWMLPSIQGIEVCRILRETPETANIPIIMISAKGEEFDRISGLERGADDYIVKPFSPAELIARIKAIFRRLRPAFSNKVLSFRDIKMDLMTHTVTRKGSEVKLAPFEFQILQMLMEHPNRVVSREAFIDKLWGVDKYVGSRTVDVHVTRLRKALLAASPDGVDIIETKRLVGYCLKYSPLEEHSSYAVATE